MNDHLDLAMLRTQVPFILPAVISTTQPTRCGRGVIVPVSAASGTDVTVTHNLGRKVQAMIPLLNNSGVSYTPQLKFGAGPATASQQSINANATMTNCLVFLV